MNSQDDGTPSYDVFLSYAYQDRAWVGVLARRLGTAGLTVWFDEGQPGIGDVLSERVANGIRASRSGIVVLSPASVSSRWVAEEIRVMLARSAIGDYRIMPVLYQDTEIPSVLADRPRLDLRHVEGPAFDAAIDSLIRVVRNDVLLELAKGPWRGRLTVAAKSVEFVNLGTGDRARQPIGPGSDQLSYALRNLERARRALGATRDVAARPETSRSAELLLRQTGSLLGEIYTPGTVGAALTRAVADARTAGNRLRLAVRSAEDLSDLPWETLIPPGWQSPLALEPAVDVYREALDSGSVPEPDIPGPLRVLVVLASPDGLGGGPLLDLERELSAILRAVEPARREARARVRVLNLGTLAAIREALLLEQFHVLHLSSHATAHELFLEDDQGRPDAVGAAQLIGAIPPRRRPAAVVLSGCWTGGPETNAALPGLARELLAAGVPQVVAMTAPVTDLYATRFGEHLYRELALASEPSMVSAVAEARRLAEAERRRLSPGRPESALVEWATPVIFAGGDPRPLYDPATASSGPAIDEPAPARLTYGAPSRPIGQFVGRRTDLRTLLSGLRRPGHPGVVLHGIAGVGKGSLAAEALHLLGAEAGPVVRLAGATTAGQILDSLDAIVFGDVLGSDPTSFLRPTERWEERLGALFAVWADQPITLLLDDFEENLGPWTGHRSVLWDGSLAAFLTRWIRRPGPYRLVITSRYLFEMPDGTEGRLAVHPVGPLSPAETRKLFWRLPGLDALSTDERERVWHAIGGHPRTLEFLDALLGPGDIPFDDVAERMRALLAARGVTNLRRWIGSRPGALEPRLAEAVTLAVADAGLDELLGLLDDDARRLLLGAAVHRRPAVRRALDWQTPDPGPAAIQAQEARLSRFADRLRTAGGDRDPATLGYSPDQIDQLRDDLDSMRHAPMSDPALGDAELTALVHRGLLSAVTDPDDRTERFAVHRWVATDLARRYPEITEQAHRRAADYYVWRVRFHPAHPVADLNDAMEARHHRHAAGDVPAAIDLSYGIQAQLHAWSAWGREAGVCTETLTWVEPGSVTAAAFIHQLGVIAQARGDYDEAAGRYRQALAVRERHDDRGGVADSIHQLAVLDQIRGDYATAERRFRDALAIREELGDRGGVAAGSHQLGMLAHHRGDYSGADNRYHHALAIHQELDDRAGQAGDHHQLGVLAQNRGDPDAAEHFGRRALALYEELGDRAGVAAGYHQLGLLAQNRADYDLAEETYLRALTLDEELGARAEAAATLHQLGNVAYLVGDLDPADDHYRQALVIFEELSDQAGVAATNAQLGAVAKLRGDHDAAARRYERALRLAESLGDRRLVAATVSQLGILATDNGEPARGAAYHLRSLSLRMSMRSPQTAVDVYWLQQLRARLAAGRFAEILDAHLDGESRRNLERLLDQFDG